MTAEDASPTGRAARPASQLPAGFDYADLRELLAVISRLTDFLHPGTSHSEPGDDQALRWAESVLSRYKPAARDELLAALKTP